MIKSKLFSSTTLNPKAVPDQTSLEEMLNTFLATLDPADVLDVLKESFSTGKYGLTTTHFAAVIYRTR